MEEQLAASLRALSPDDAAYASRFVEILLAAGRGCGASDLHLQPTPQGLELHWRVDGVLAPLGVFPPGVAANVIARLKVLAGLLTYRNDVPQEGRIRAGDTAIETRVSTFPTLHGERAAVRLLGEPGAFQSLAALGLPADIFDALRRSLAETSGAILITGPAGSGKTTTLYAALRHLADDPLGRRNIVTLEDPIEVAIAGIAQSQVHPAAGFDLATGLRSVLRQDPEVIMIGEIRDAATAGQALEAALTGQLVLSSFHAGSSCEALGRLLDMGLEPYVLRSGLRAVLFQRLARRLCDCARESRDPAEKLGLNVRQAKTPVGCDACAGLGYRGRTVLAELAPLDHAPLAQAILARADVGALEEAARGGGLIDRWARACQAIEEGITSPAEVRRVLGFSRNSALAS